MSDLRKVEQMTRSGKKFTRLLISIVSGLGILSFIILLTDPLVIKTSNLQATGQESGGPPQERGPASISKVIGAKPSRDLTVKLDCNNETQNEKTDSLRFRLEGLICSPDATSSEELAQIEITNKSNGYVATVFRDKNNKFFTDYINLNEGSNQIHVEFSLNGSRQQKTLNVVRNNN